MNDFMMYDVSAFFIFLTLIVSNITKNIVKGKTSRLYTLTLIICTITLLFRLIYQIILRACPYTHNTVVVASVFIYLALIWHSIVYPMGIYFVLSSLGILPLVTRSSTLRMTMLFLSFIPIIYILMDFVSHTLFIINENMTVTWCDPIWILIICIVMIMLFGFGLSAFYWCVLEKKQVIYCAFLYPLNIGLFILQSIFPQAQVEMFVLAMTMYLIFATIQRPELLINLETLAQSSFAFDNELKKMLNVHCSSKIIFIQIANSKNISMYIGNERFSNLLKKVTLYLRNFTKTEKLNATVYYLNDYIYALPTEGQTDEMVEDALNLLERYFSQIFVTDGIKVNLETRILVLRTPDDVDDFDFLSYISHAFFKNVENTGKPQWYRDYARNRGFIIKNNIDKILTRAIENKSFDVFYQPIYNVPKKKYCSAEALVRLTDEEFGNIPPSMFIAHAERTNQIHIIGDFVLEKVCEFLGSQKPEALGLEYIEVNLSAAQCMESDLVEKIRSWLEKYNVSPDKLRLEITESAASFNPQIVEKNINSLKTMGINFALDDYGTGYSNIKKVISLPFDVVKLNKSFVYEQENSSNSSIVEDTIHMLRMLGKEILVSGIETEEQAQLFTGLKDGKKHSCEYLQGFYFSHPLSQSEFVKFLTM